MQEEIDVFYFGSNNMLANYYLLISIHCQKTIEEKEKKKKLKIAKQKQKQKKCKHWF